MMAKGGNCLYRAPSRHWSALYPPVRHQARSQGHAPSRHRAAPPLRWAFHRKKVRARDSPGVDEALSLGAELKHEVLVRH
jgi:hypothetical protein